MGIIIPISFILPVYSDVPASGELTMLGLAREKVYDNYISSNTPTGPYSMHDLVLGGNLKGSGVSFDSTNNSSSSNPPDSVAPHAMSEWHSYNHDYQSATNYASSNYIRRLYANSSGQYGDSYTGPNSGYYLWRGTYYAGTNSSSTFSQTVRIWNTHSSKQISVMFNYNYMLYEGVYAWTYSGTSSTQWYTINSGSTFDKTIGYRFANTNGGTGNYTSTCSHSNNHHTIQLTAVLSTVWSDNSLPSNYQDTTTSYIVTYTNGV